MPDQVRHDSVFCHPGLDPGAMLSSFSGKESEDGCRIKSGMTVFFCHPGLDPGSILASAQTRAVAADLQANLSRCRAAQGVAGVQRALQAERAKHIGFDAAVELLQGLQRQL